MNTMRVHLLRPETEEPLRPEIEGPSSHPIISPLLLDLLIRFIISFFPFIFSSFILFLSLATPRVLVLYNIFRFKGRLTKTMLGK
jgi:hypothetical protein